MTDRDADDPAGGAFECVEPSLGDQLWRRGVAATDAGLRRQLEAHLEVCDACRLRVAVEQRVACGLADGSLRAGADEVDEPPAPSRRPGLGLSVRAGSPGGALRLAGTTALAASIALVFLLPPAARDAGRVERSAAQAPRILRPVEGEVLLDRTPEVRWQQVVGATAYDLTIRGDDGAFRWQIRVTLPRAVVPDANALPVADDLLATVVPVPADLAPPQGISASFRVGNAAAFLRHRLTSAHNTVAGLALVGLATLIAGLVYARKRS